MIATALFAVLAILVGADALTGLDQAALDHVMPALTDTVGDKPHLEFPVFPIFSPSEHHDHVALAAVAYGTVFVASALPAILIVAVCLLVLWRRGRRKLSIAIGTTFVVANAIEVIGKATISRSPLYDKEGGGARHLEVFDMSFPSGHALRAFLLAVCLGLCLPKLRGVLTVWVVACSVLLVVGAWHVPTDVAGGLLLGAAAALGAIAIAGEPDRPQPETRPRKSSGKVPRRSGAAFVTRKLSSTRRPPPPSQ